jgi:hypothetical protein
MFLMKSDSAYVSKIRLVRELTPTKKDAPIGRLDIITYRYRPTFFYDKTTCVSGYTTFVDYLVLPGSYLPDNTPLSR